ncbi:MAG TPA: thiamine-phosphate kinase [Acidobacteriota bacterium]|nr:thiamine-phosphate kinase [Acidobacteriota bacterium]
MRVDEIGELDLVERIRSALETGASGVEVGPGDDAAVIDMSERRLVLTTDRQTEGVHFRRSWLSPWELGRRALAVCVSDLGAMGATPTWALCALELPPDLGVEWLDGVVAGLRDGGRELGCPTIGGDVTLSARCVGMCLCAGGTLAAGVPPTLRDRATVGDACWLIGDLGMAAAGRLLLSSGGNDPSDALAHRGIEAYRMPTPPLSFARHVAERRLVGAMMDVSDGLGLDLTRLCAASRVGVALDADALLAADVTELASRLGRAPLSLAVGGGDDYALLCSVGDGDQDDLVAAAARFEVNARRIGVFVAAADGLTVRNGATDEPLGSAGWDPFAAGSTT